MVENAHSDEFADTSTGSVQSLRQRAEDVLQRQPEELQEMPPEDIQHLIHELRVHQIELEMQNEELHRTQREMELARDRYLDLYDFAPVGYLTVSEVGLILQANLTAATMLGVDRARLIRQPLSRFILSEDQDIYYLHRKQAFETRMRQTCDVEMVRKDGTQFYAQLESIVIQDSDGSYSRCRTVLSDITERVRAEAEINARNRELATLNAIADVVSQSLELDTILNAALDRVLEVMGVDTGAIFLLDQETGPLALTVQRGLTEGYLRSFSTVNLGQECSGTAAQTGQILSGQAIDENAAMCPASEELLGQDCFVTVPLKSKEKVVGVLELWAPRRRRITVEETRLLESVGRQIGVAVENAWLYEQVREHSASLARRLEMEDVLSNISARFVQTHHLDEAINHSLEEMGRLARAHRSYVFLFDDNGRTMDNTHEWCSEGTTPQIQNLQGLDVDIFPWWMDKLRRNGNVVISDVAQLPPEAGAEKEILEMQDIRSLLVVPLQCGGRLRGFMGFDDVEGARVWQDEDVRLLRTAGEIIARGIERAQAEEALRQSASSLEAANLRLLALNRVGLRAQEAFQVEDIFAVVVGELKALGFNSVALLREDENLVIRHTSIEPALLAAAEEVIGTKMIGYAVPIDTPALQPVVEVKETVFLAEPLHPVAEILSLRAGPGLDEGLEMMGMGRVIAAPLIARDRVIGLLALWSHDLEEGDVPAVTAFANQMAIAIENARLYEQIREQRVEEQATLLRLSQEFLATLEPTEIMRRTVEVAVEALRADCADLMLLDEDEKTLTLGFSHGREHLIGRLQTPNSDDSFPGYIVRHRTPVIVEDTASDGRFQAGPLLRGDGVVVSALGVPVMAGEKTIGALIVDTQAPRRFSQEQQRFLSLIANQAGLAIEAARQHQATKQAEARYQGLFDGVPVGLYRTTPQGRLLDANLALAEMLGYPDRESLLAVNAAEIYTDPADRRHWQSLIDESGVVREFETRFRRRDGDTIWVRDDARAIRDNDSRILHYEGSLEDITARERAEEALRNIAEGVSAATGGEFFILLVQYLARILEVDYAFIGELTGEEERVRTIAVCARGEIVENFEYDLAGTPCMNVAGKELSYYPDDLQQRFPQDQLLVEMEVESYMGTPLWDSAGRPLGILVVLHGEPLSDPQTAQSMLRIFAVRASAELERVRAEQALQESTNLLEAISSAQTQYISDADPRVLFDEMLSNLLSVTQSEYGFIGEVFYTPSGDPYLRTHAITNIAWNEETQAFYEQYALTGMEFRNLKTLFGAVMTTGQPVIANDPATDPRRGGLPEGHPPLNAFLGLPLYQGEKLAGMAGVSNRPGGYDEGLVAYLQPLLDTCANIIQGYRNDQERRESVRALEAIAEVGGLVTAGGDLQVTLDTLAEKIAQATGFEAVGIGLYNAEREVLTYPSLYSTVTSGLLAGRKGTTIRLEDAPVLQYLVREKRYLLIDDLQNDPWMRKSQRELMHRAGVQAVLTMPLLFHQELVGALDLISTSRRVFSPEDVSLLTTLADQTATAVQNARLYQEAQQRLARLAALGEVHRAITSTLNLDEMPTIILQNVIAVSQVDTATVMLVRPDC